MATKKFRLNILAKKNAPQGNLGSLNHPPSSGEISIEDSVQPFTGRMVSLTAETFRTQLSGLSATRLTTSLTQSKIGITTFGFEIQKSGERPMSQEDSAKLRTVIERVHFCTGFHRVAFQTRPFQPLSVHKKPGTN